MTSDVWRMILIISIKYTINIVIIRYIVYDNICLMVRKINYFIFIYFIYSHEPCSGTGWPPAIWLIGIGLELCQSSTPFSWASGTGWPPAIWLTNTGPREASSYLPLLLSKRDWCRGLWMAASYTVRGAGSLCCQIRISTCTVVTVY